MHIQQTVTHLMEKLKTNGNYENFRGFKAPSTVDWGELIQKSEDRVKTEPGFSLNQETIELDFEHFTPYVPDTYGYKMNAEFPRGKVFEAIIKEYQETHYIPGIEYLQWLYENPSNKVSTYLRDDKSYFVLGTYFDYPWGESCVPRGRWLSGRDRSTGCLWHGNRWSIGSSKVNDFLYNDENIVLLKRN